MYMNDIKLFAKNEKELETLIKAVRIYSHDIGMEFGIEKYTTLIRSSGKRHIMEGIRLEVCIKNKEILPKTTQIRQE